MANLLPREVRESEARAQRDHFVFALSVGLIVAAAISFVALLPAYLLLHAQVSALTNQVQNSQSQQDAVTRVDLTRSRDLLKEFSDIASSTGIDALSAALAEVPPGLNINAIDYSRAQGDKDGSIVLTGSGAAREEVSALRLSLAVDKRFANISVPVNVLAGAEEGNFSVTLTGAF